MKYKYVAYSESSGEVKGTLETESIERAEEMLWGGGLAVLSLKKQLQLPPLGELLPTFFGIKRQDIINFSRDLATLLESGISILRALDILHMQTRKGSMKLVLHQIVEDLNKGNTFSEACAHHPKVFPIFFIRLLGVGEEVGNLPLVLQQLSSHMEKDEAMARKIKGALAYPIFILCLAAVTVFIMLSFVMPSLSGLFAEFGEGLPVLARIMVDMGDFMGSYFLHVLLGIILLIAVLWVYFRTPNGRRVRDIILLKLPMLGEIVHKGGLARLVRNLSVMIKAGVNLTEALELSIQTSDNTVAREALEGSREKVFSGESLSQAMASYSIFPVLMPQMIAVGEETGRLEYNLEVLSKIYEDETDRAASRFTGIIAPALTIVVGLIVGFVAVTMFSSIYSVAGVIK